MTAPERIWADFTLLHDQVTTFYCQDGPYSGGTEYVRADLAAVQPAQVLVKPLDKSTLQSVYENTPDIAGLPDAYQPRNIASALEVFRASATEPQPDPRDEVIARLVGALKDAADSLDDYSPFTGNTIETSASKRARAALAAAKALPK